MTTAKDPIQVELDPDEALVLFEWLARNDGSLPISDPSEEMVLWHLEGQLEKKLTEPLAANYADALNAARSRVRAKQQ